MWDSLCVLLSLACFAAAVLYVHACALLKGENKNG